MRRFKRSGVLWMSILAFFLLSAGAVQAEDLLEPQSGEEQYQSADYTYSNTSTTLYPDLAGTICIDSYSGPEVSVQIPSMLDNKTVTTLGPGAFSGSQIEEVFVPNTIQGAPINWINGVITSAFSECTRLKTIIFENGMEKVPSQICWNCQSLTNAEIQEGTKKIGENAFRGCSSLAEVCIPASVETIPYNAFYDCPNLVICGAQGSYAQTYAEKYGITFRIHGEPTDIQLNASSLSLPKGASRTLTAEILPPEASQEVIWSTSDPEIATVSDGIVTAKKAGTATITARTKNNLSASCTVHVTPPDASGVILSKSALTLLNGNTETLTASVQPSDASQTVSWSSSDPSVATVSGGTVKGVAAGTATITAKTSNGKSASCTVTVKLPDAVLISLNPTSLKLEIGGSARLSATVSPAGASQSVSWSSSNPSVATVSGGTVRAVAAGTATITAKTSNGKSAACQVTVSKTEEDQVPIYRLYLPATGEHLYTSDYNEYKTLYQLYGWGQEGVAWYAPSSGTAVYRLYHPGLKNHLYTTDANEVKVLTAKYGWRQDNGEKPLYYSGGEVPIYRVYNAGLNGMHHLTTDTNEYQILPKYGWKQEGVKLKAVRIGSPITTRFYK